MHPIRPPRSSVVFGVDWITDKLSQEVRRGQRKVAERGYYPGNKAPYGYELKKIKEEDGNALHDIFVKDPVTAPIARRIFDESIAGRTYTDIREGLDRDHVPPPEPKNKKDAESERWSDSTIFEIVHNLHYAGFIVWGVNSESGDPPIIAKGRHEPIVSEDEFNLAGHDLASKAPANAHPKQTASVYMLSRMLLCRNCGESLTVRPSKNQSSCYFQCRTRRLDGVEVCPCPNLNIQEFDQRVPTDGPRSLSDIYWGLSKKWAASSGERVRLRVVCGEVDHGQGLPGLLAGPSLFAAPGAAGVVAGGPSGPVLGRRGRPA